MENELSNSEHWTKERIVGNILAILATVSIFLLYDTPTRAFDRLPEKTSPSTSSVIFSLLYVIIIPLALLPIFYTSFDYFKNMERTLSLVCVITYIANIFIFGLTNMIIVDKLAFFFALECINHVLMVGTLGGLSYWLTVLRPNT